MNEFLVTCQHQATASDLPFYDIFAPHKNPSPKVSDDVIACDLGATNQNSWLRLCGGAYIICENMLIYSQGQTKTKFLDESLKNNCSKADYKTSKIKTLVSRIWLKASKNYFANRPNQGLPHHQFVPKHIFRNHLSIYMRNVVVKTKVRFYFTRPFFQILHFLCVKGFSPLAPNTNHSKRIHQAILLHGAIKQYLPHKHPFLSASLT